MLLRSKALLATLLLIAAPLLACREPEPMLRLWPSADGAIPLTPGSGASSARQEGSLLVVDLPRAGDWVSTRGGHALPAEANPVLRLKARLRTMVAPTLRVWAAPPGGKISLDPPRRRQRDRVLPMEVAVAKRYSERPQEILVPLASGWGGGSVDLIGLGFVSEGSLVLEEVEVLPMTPLLRVRCFLQDLVALRGRGPNFYLASGCVLLLAPWGLLRLGRRILRPASARSGRPFVPAIVIGAVVVAWGVQGARAALSHLDRAIADFHTYRGVSQGERRRASLGDVGHSLSRLVDQWVPADAPLGLLPMGPSLPSFWLCSAVTPRPIVPLECQSLPQARAVDYLAAREGCYEHPLEILSPSDSLATTDRPWLARIEPSPEIRHLVGFRVTFDDGELQDGEDASVTIREEGGKILLREPIHRPSPYRRSVHVPMAPGRGAEIEIMARRITGGDGLLQGVGIEVLKLPQGWDLLAMDGYGSIVARRAGVDAGPVKRILRGEERAPRRTELPRLVLGLLLALLLGEAVMRWLFAGERGPEGIERLALAWLVGIGTATLLMHYVAYLHLPHWPLVLLPLGVIVVVGLRTRRPMARATTPAPPMAPDEKALSLLSAGIVLLAFVAACSAPMREWDEVINWGYRAHVYHYVGATEAAVKNYAELSPRHKAYPPGLPLAEAYATLAAGRWDDARARAPIPLYHAAGILLVVGAVRSSGGRRIGLLYGVLAATAPFALYMSSIGMADLPLGVLMLAAILCLDRWQGTHDGRGWLLLAGLLGALMSFTKLDGGALKLMLLLLALLKAAALHEVPLRHRATHLAGMALLAFAPILPWWHVYAKLGLSDWVVNADTLDPSYLLAKLSLLPEVARALGTYLFTSDWGFGPMWGAAYVQLLALLLAAPLALGRPRIRLLAAALGFGIVGYSFIYVVSPQGLYQMHRSLDRILLHFAPLAIALAGRWHAFIVLRGGAPSAEIGDNTDR